MIELILNASCNNQNLKFAPRHSPSKAGVLKQNNLNMENQELQKSKYLVSAKSTHQVSNEEWERFSENIEVNPSTTVEDIFKWAKTKGVDITTIRVYQLENIETDNF
ncbi:hypothetical protein [Elizabethkingia meningoseptica]|nr:hypothetical protein [Elizabethkingia meningoseptica]